MLFSKLLYETDICYFEKQFPKLYFKKQKDIMDNKKL